MNSPDDDAHRELSAEEEQEVAELLAEAGGPEPVPAEVAARLDAALAGLVADPDTRSGTDAGAVVALAERRQRRRRWPRVMLAAAAVVVGGYGVGAVVTQSSLSGTDAASSSAGGSADSSMPATDERAREGGGRDRLLDDAPEGSVNGSRDLKAPGGANAQLTTDEPVRLRSEQLEADVRQVLRVTAASDTAARSELHYRALDEGCLLPEHGRRDSWLPARLDGWPAVLVTGPERAGTVEAVVYSCAGEQLDAVTVEAP